MAATIHTEEQQHLARERLTLATRAAGLGIWEHDLVTNQIVWDDQMYRLFGSSPDSFENTHEAFMSALHPDDREKRMGDLMEAQEGMDEFHDDFRVVWPDGSVHHIHADSIVIRDLEGKPLRMVGINRDVTAREGILEALARSHDENQMLLRELQHRAKNSFNMIVSMIQMASLAHGDADVRKAIDDLGVRVGAVAEFYSLLYASSSPGELRLDEYCSRVALPLVALSRNVELKLELESMDMAVSRMVPLGLILTELLTNALKYAFPDSSHGTITVALTKGGSSARLTVRDDGVGMPEGQAPDQESGTGLVLVKELCRQIGARFRIEDSTMGTACLVEFGLSGGAPQDARG